MKGEIIQRKKALEEFNHYCNVSSKLREKGLTLNEYCFTVNKFMVSRHEENGSSSPLWFNTLEDIENNLLTTPTQ